jgi:Enoyl-CoA hydratase/isomerase
VNAPPGSADSSVLRFLAALSTADKPVVAAVNGLAVGVGTTMLLHCDLVYAARSATFSVPFVNLALVPEAASSLLLPRRIGHAKAAELFLLGGRLDAAEAEDRTSDQPKSLAAGRATMSPRMLGAIQFDRRGMTRVVGAGHAGRAIGSGANDSSNVIWPAWREH